MKYICLKLTQYNEDLFDTVGIDSLAILCIYKSPGLSLWPW